MRMMIDEQKQWIEQQVATAAAQRDWSAWFIWPDFSQGDDAQPDLYVCPSDCTPTGGMRQIGTIADVLV